MGIRHFEMLLNDAVELDRQAVPLAIQIYESTKALYTRATPLQAPVMWKDMHFDTIVRLSRGLLAVRDRFTQKLQDLLVKGKIHATFMVPGGRQRVRDPACLSFDDLCVSVPMLCLLVQQYPRSQYGEKN